MAPRKRQRNNNPRASPASPTLPADLLLLIAARSDPRTIVRCSATCKVLRRDIADASFIRQAAEAVVPTRVLLAYTRRRRRRNHRRKPFISLVHPATPAASSFADKHLAPFVSRGAADDLLGRYVPVTSRRGLIVLRRFHYVRGPRNSDLCVYNPMTGDRIFLSGPPGLSFDLSTIGRGFRPCVLLTAADGISCSSFLLFFANHRWFKGSKRCMRIQTATPSEAGDTSWGPVTEYIGHPLDQVQDHHDAVVLPGGVIHWLQRGRDVLTYNVRTGKLGWVELPVMPTDNNDVHLGMLPEGRLRFLIADWYRMTVTVWKQLPRGRGWERGAVIHVEEKLQLLDPKIFLDDVWIKFGRSGERTNAVLLSLYHRGPLILLDLETKEMRKHCVHPSFVFEIDLSERLQAMTIFS
ncbi:hypothetical protein VPH35_131390 [Triticum aestivum]